MFGSLWGLVLKQDLAVFIVQVGLQLKIILPQPPLELLGLQDYLFLLSCFILFETGSLVSHTDWQLSM